MKIIPSSINKSLANFNHLVANGTVNLNYETIAAEMTVNGNFNANTTSNFHGLLTANRVAVFNDNIKANSILSVKGTSSFDSLSTVRFYLEYILKDYGEHNTTIYILENNSKEKYL